MPIREYCSFKIDKVQDGDRLAGVYKSIFLPKNTGTGFGKLTGWPA